MALGILVCGIVAATFGLVPVEIAACTGALLMVVARVITPMSAARALDWNVLFILAGSVGLGAIVVGSGIAAKIAEGITYLSAGSVRMVVVAIVIATSLLNNITTNAAGSLDSDAGGVEHRDRDEPRAGDSAGPDRHMHLVHIHQPVQPPVQPDGAGAGRLRHGVVRPVRVPLFAVSLVAACVMGYLLVA